MPVLIIVQFIVILVLVALLVTSLKEERIARRETMPRGKLAEAWSGKERRQYVRVPAALEVRYAAAESQPLKRSIQTKDISRGGIGFVLDEKLAIGAKLYLEINAEKCASSIRAQGEVRWVKEGPPEKIAGSEKRTFITGIIFTGLDPRDEEKFQKYMRGLLATREDSE